MVFCDPTLQYPGELVTSLPDIHSVPNLSKLGVYLPRVPVKLGADQAL